MAKGEAVGNTDDSKRGRGLGPEGRPSKGAAKDAGAKGGKARSVDDPDTDGRPIGGRGRGK